MRVKSYLVLFPLMLLSAFAGGTLALLLQGNVSAQESDRPRIIDATMIRLSAENGAVYALLTPQGIFFRNTVTFDQPLRVRGEEKSVTTVGGQGVWVQHDNRKMIELSLYEHGKGGAGLKIYDRLSQGQAGLVASEGTRALVLSDREGSTAATVGVLDSEQSSFALLADRGQRNQIHLEISPQSKVTSSMQIRGQHGDVLAFSGTARTALTITDKVGNPVWAVP